MLTDCPQCKSPIGGSGATVCDRCGAELLPREASEEPRNSGPKDDTEALDPATNPESGLDSPGRRASLRIILSSGDAFNRDISRPETSIGKGPRNDIVLADPAVSTNHAVIGLDAGGYSISDVGSRNGTFVGGVRITDKHKLRHGDVITVGRSKLTIRIPSASDTVPITAPARLVGVLPSGDKIDYVINRAEVAIGKGLHNDIVLADPTVSNSHALVLSREGGYNIVDLGSRNGTLVAGERLGDQAHILRHGDAIKVGQTLLTFRNPTETAENLTARLSNEFVAEVRRRATAESDSAAGDSERPMPAGDPVESPSQTGQPSPPTTEAVSAIQAGEAPRSTPEAPGAEPKSTKDKKEKNKKEDKKSEKKAKEDERVKAAYVRAVGTIVASVLGILLSVGIALYVNNARSGAGKSELETNKKGKTKVKIGGPGEATSFEGGTFQASGAVQIPGTSAVLFVDYDRPTEVLRMELNDSGRQAGAIRSLPLGLTVKEPEGIAYGGSYFYVVSSLADSSAGEQNTLVRFTLDPSGQTMQGKVDAIGDLRSFLLANVPELKDAGAKKAKDGGLFVGGVAWDPDREWLLIGLQSPLAGGKALIVPIKLRDPHGPFSTDNLVLAGTETIKISLGGHGLRSIEHDGKLKSFVIISSDAETSEKKVFKLWEWEPGSDSGPTEQSTLDAKIKPHGIARVRVGASEFLWVVGDGSGYMKLDYPQSE